MKTKEYLLEPKAGEITVQTNKDCLPMGAIIKNQDIYVVCMVDDTSPKVIKSFMIVPCGEDINGPAGAGLTNIGVVQKPLGLEKGTNMVIWQTFVILEIIYQKD